MIVGLRAVSERWLITVRILRQKRSRTRKEERERRRDHTADGVNVNRMLASIAAFSGEESVSVESCFNSEASLCRSGGGPSGCLMNLSCGGGALSSRQQIAKGSNR